jgi:hypothetical protein
MFPSVGWVKYEVLLFTIIYAMFGTVIYMLFIYFFNSFISNHNYLDSISYFTDYIYIYIYIYIYDLKRLIQ